MDKIKVLNVGIEILEGVDLSEVEDITVVSGVYLDGKNYTTISIEYLEPKETLGVESKEVIK